MAFYTDIIVFLILIVASFALAQLFSFLISLYVFPKNRRGAKFSGRLISYSIYLCALYYGIVYVLKQDINSLITAFGIIGIAIAFASQQTFANVFASVVMTLQGLLREGDFIEVAGIPGKVSDVRLLYVVLKGYDGRIVNIPKSIFLTSSFVNYSSGKVLRVALPLDVSAKVSFKKVEAALLRICNDNKDVLPEIYVKTNIFERIFTKNIEKRVYNPRVVVKSIFEDFNSIELRVWIFDIAKKDKIISDLYLKIIEEFKRKKISLRKI